MYLECAVFLRLMPTMAYLLLVSSTNLSAPSTCFFFCWWRVAPICLSRALAPPPAGVARWLLAADRHCFASLLGCHGLHTGRVAMEDGVEVEDGNPREDWRGAGAKPRCLVSQASALRRWRRRMALVSNILGWMRQCWCYGRG